MNKTILQLKDLKKSFREKKTELKIIDNLNLEVKEGDFIAVLGKSGSGKSTFLNLIGILDKPDSGEIFIENKNVNELKEEERDLLRNRFLGFIFQFHYLLPEFSALENVMMPALINKKNDKKKIEEKAIVNGLVCSLYELTKSNKKLLPKKLFGDFWKCNGDIIGN